MVLAAAFSPDGKWVAASYDYDSTERRSPRKPRKLALWEVATGKRRWVTYKGEEPGISRLAFFPDSKRILVLFKDRLEVMDAATGKVTKTLVKAAQKVSCFAFSPDGRFLLVAYWRARSHLRLLDATTGKWVREFKGGKIGPAESLGFAPIGHLAFSECWGGEEGMSHSVCLWDVASGKPRHGFPQKGSWGGPVAFTRDSNFTLLVQTNGLSGEAHTARVVLWGINTDKVRRTLPN
jgi:WD40 repeat protein